MVADDIPVADEIDITGFSFSGLIFEGPEWGAFLPGSRRPLPAIQDNFPAACKRTLIDEAIRRAIAHAPHDRNRQFAPRTSRIFAISHNFVAYCPIAMAFMA